MSQRDIMDPPELDRTQGMDRPFGPVAAVLVAAGIGVLVLGILTTLSEVSDGVKSFLQWSDAVGPLMGVVILASAAFLVAWAVLYAMWRTQDPAERPIWTAMIVLLATGFLLTFPPFFQLFESG
jgi:hypothetical protein